MDKHRWVYLLDIEHCIVDKGNHNKVSQNSDTDVAQEGNDMDTTSSNAVVSPVSPTLVDIQTS